MPRENKITFLPVPPRVSTPGLAQSEAPAWVESGFGPIEDGETRTVTYTKDGFADVVVETISEGACTREAPNHEDLIADGYKLTGSVQKTPAP
jgi:hypothetical protein